MENGNAAGIRYHICFFIIWAAQMAAAFYFCVQKQGFHEDEYYTYYSTARTNGFYVEDGEWMDRDVYRDEFVVLPGQRFQYGFVKQVQSWDVHPPMYYWIFHTVASLVPGVFSKWIGLSVNLFFFGINIFLLTYLSYLVGGRNAGLAFLVAIFAGLSPAAMSGVVFIRMYEMLTTTVLVCSILHVRAMGIKEDKLPVLKCLLPMAAVTYIGFLSQYYYFIFLFYLAAAFALWLLWRDKNIGNCLRYGVCQGGAFVLAYLTYPSCLGQMFRGQRGAQATENFFDMSNTVQRLRFFWGLLDTYVFGNMLPAFLLVVLVLAVTAHRQRSAQRMRRMKQGTQPEIDSGEATVCEEEQGGFGAAFWMLVFATLGYFVTVSKTALLLGDTSNRYQLPVYGIIVLLVFQAIWGLWKRVVFSSDGKCFDRGERTGKWIKSAWTVCALVCLVIDGAGLMSGKTVFLYPEEREQIVYAEKMAQQGVPVVYLYETGAEWCIWDVANELFVHPTVYFAAVQGDVPIADDRIRNADELVVYMAKGADAGRQAERIFRSNPGLEEDSLVFEQKYCDVYYFSK